MAAFLGGALSGYSGTASSRDKQGKKGIFRKKNKSPSDYPPSPDQTGAPWSMKRGGKVRKTGFVKLHKGETVTPVKKRSRRGGKRR